MVKKGPAFQGAVVFNAVCKGIIGHIQGHTKSFLILIP